jgi:ABC-type Fe3+ transport system substrate-binding protein
MVYLKLGEEFFKKLYIDQKPTVIRDARQLGDALARGTHPIVLGLGVENYELVKQEGFPVDLILSLPEMPAIAGGQPQMGLMANAPHPAAARLFLNWAASKEGMEFLTKSARNVPIRLDADKAGLAAFLIPEPDREYVDTYDWDFAVNTRLALSPKVRSLLH